MTSPGMVRMRTEGDERNEPKAPIDTLESQHTACVRIVPG
jgi:hypothetical protein